MQLHNTNNGNDWLKLLILESNHGSYPSNRNLYIKYIVPHIYIKSTPKLQNPNLKYEWRA